MPLIDSTSSLWYSTVKSEKEPDIGLQWLQLQKVRSIIHPSESKKMCILLLVSIGPLFPFGGIAACVDYPFSSSSLPFGCLGRPEGFASRRRVIDHIAWVLEVADRIIRAEPGSLSIMYSAAPSKFLLLVLFRSMKETLLVGSAQIRFPISLGSVLRRVLQYCLDWQSLFCIFNLQRYP